MGDLIIIWFAFNVVFCLWSAHNWFTWLFDKTKTKPSNQIDRNQLLELIVSASCLALYLVHTGYSL